MLDEIIAIIEPLLLTAGGQRASLAAVTMGGLLLLFSLVNAPITWYDDYQQGHSPSSSSTALPPVMNHDFSHILRIPDQHLFGESETAAFPVTRLPLHLMGVIHATGKNASRAIISEASQPGKIYQTGDILPSGARITAITSDGVILENGRQKEKLPLVRPSLSFNSEKSP
jgi:type II secretory pathway component PulC